MTAIVLEHGGDEDEAIAALLHDAVEDQGGAPTLEEIRRRFGERVGNKKFEVHVLDPKKDWRDNVRLTLYADDGGDVHHHFRSYEVVRLIEALNQALAFGPPIPKRPRRSTGRRRR